MADGYVLTEKDRDALKRKMGSLHPWPNIQGDRDPELGQSSDVFVAKVQTDPGRIPARIDDAANGYWEPGCAMCDLYQIVPGDADHLYNLLQISNSAVPVFNVSDSDVGDEWIVVAMDRHGHWVSLTLPYHALIPFELYDDIAPSGTTIEAWLLNPDTLEHDEEQSRVYVNDGILGDVRALGSVTKTGAGTGTAYSEGAKGFFTTIGGVNQIVSIQRQAKWCSASIVIAGTGTSESSVGPGETVSVDTVVPLDGGQSPVESSSDTLSCTMPPAARALDNAVCVIEWDETTDAWKIVQVHEQAKWCKCKAKISSGITLSVVDNVVPMDGGQSPVSSSSTEITLTATGWETDDNADGLIVWDEDSDVWRPVDFPCPT